MYASMMSQDPSKFVKFRKNEKASETGEEFKLSVVVLSGCFRQWKTDENIIYIPGFNICGYSEQLKDFLKKYTTSESIKYILEHSFTSTSIPKVITKYFFEKVGKDNLTVKKEENFDAEAFFNTHSKVVKKTANKEDLIADLKTAYAFIKEKNSKEKKDDEPVEKKAPKDIVIEKVNNLKEDQHLNVTDFKDNGSGTRIEKKTLKDGKTSKIKDTAVYIKDNVFFYKTESGDIPESVVNFCARYFKESKEEAMSRLSAL